MTHGGKATDRRGDDATFGCGVAQVPDDEPAPVSQPRHKEIAGRRGLNDQTRIRLGNHLRTLYDSVIQQPVPDRFRDLIARLDDGDKKI
ncbi:hypothetical protein MPOCJGCO_3609 [Methylobacterium trifolii]|uniref:Anti-sigma factor NepR domain-containing protein n=2 Tax=Methylobacterium trifolii TaxID=1003092 RepID=A0ABQ4U2W5_9HYPH|nr:hypothetical protein MPOCJGCO_3609 [Methylobacterium trifolii]